MNSIVEDTLEVLRPVIRSQRRAERLLERYWRDKMAIVWTTVDVHRAANEMEVALTEKEAREVLATLSRQHNKQLGLRWEDVTGHITAHVLGRKLSQRELRQFVKRDQITVQR